MKTKTIYVECAGAIVFNNKKEIAIVNQNHDSWSLPKGHIDQGESKLEAAKRELYEETGIKNANFIHPIGNYGRYRIGLDGENDKSEYKMIYMFFFFTCKFTHNYFLTKHELHNNLIEPLWGESQLTLSL